VLVTKCILAIASDLNNPSKHFLGRVLWTFGSYLWR